MSNIIKVYEGQTIFDVAMQHTGLIENAYFIYIHNFNQGIMTDFDEDIANSTIEIPDGLSINNHIVEFYTKNKSIVLNK